MIRRILVLVMLLGFGSVLAQPLSEGELQRFINEGVGEQVIKNEVTRRGLKGPLSVDTVLLMSDQLSEELQVFLIDSAADRKEEDVDRHAQLCVALSQKDREWVAELIEDVDFRDAPRECRNVHFFWYVFNNDWYDIGITLINRYPTLISSYSNSSGYSYLDSAYTWENDKWVEIMEAAGFPYQSVTRKNYYYDPKVARMERERERRESRERVARNQRLLLQAGKIIAGANSGGSGNAGASMPSNDALGSGSPSVAGSGGSGGAGNSLSGRKSTGDAGLSGRVAPQKIHCLNVDRDKSEHVGSMTFLENSCGEALGVTYCFGTEHGGCRTGVGSTDVPAHDRRTIFYDWSEYQDLAFIGYACAKSDADCFDTRAQYSKRLKELSGGL